MEFIKSISKAVWAEDALAPAQEADADWKIIERVHAGEIEAFDEIVTRYQKRIYSIIYNLTSNREDASDVAQDVFIKAFRHLHRFRGQSSFFTWLYRIAINTSMTHLRRNRMRRFFSLDPFNEEGTSSEVMEHLADPMNGDKSLLLNELQEKLNESLQKLSLKHRMTVVLFDIEGLSHQEIAKIMRCSEGTVRSRLQYAREQLQSWLSPYLK
ncbi:MAG: RNA polymerase subunit sigma-24 [Verrucomicrobia bacterium 21-51-4]|nr:MAG: RNA polymerase subunit sigma-24 [Verrucomicrobia bacterium 21-51-4]HQU08402.1 sigma-70 family RNA polymerase sigma factor [Opitutales bacterium]